MHPILKITIATVAYALGHSLLASRTVKRAAAAVIGEGNCRALYRPFYILQALVATGALYRYTSGLETPVLYRVRGAPAVCLRAAQLLALLHAYTATREIGILRITGFDGLLLHLSGTAVPEAPVAQGPEADVASGRLSTRGPFTWSRHPLNFSAVPLFWLTPKLTEGRLAFNIVATAYLVLGSLHEERRLHHAYGRRYQTYVQSGVPFFLPRPRSMRG